MVGQGEYEAVHAGLLVPGWVHCPGFFRPLDCFLVLFGAVMRQAEGMETGGIAICGYNLLHETHWDGRVRHRVRSQSESTNCGISAGQVPSFSDSIQELRASLAMTLGVSAEQEA